MRRAYRNIGYYFLAILAVILIGYYASYLRGVPASNGVSGFAHLYFVAFLLWFALLIIQPFLIKQKRPELHRKLGKSSYLIVPILVITAHEMQRIGYYAHLAELPEEQRLGALLNTYLDLFFFVLFYMMAMFYKADISRHICFMVGTSLVLLGPGLGLLLSQVIRNGAMAEMVAFAVQQAIIILFVVYEKRKVRKDIWKSPWILLFGLMLLKAGLYFGLPETSVWQSLAGLIVRWLY